MCSQKRKICPVCQCIQTCTIDPSSCCPQTWHCAVTRYCNGLIFEADTVLINNPSSRDYIEQVKKTYPNYIEIAKEMLRFELGEKLKDIKTQIENLNKFRKLINLNDLRIVVRFPSE
jgi:hypothetical protein